MDPRAPTGGKARGGFTDGRGLLFLHGAGGRHLVWQHQLLAFPQAAAPDLPGREGGAPQDVDGYLDRLRAEMEVLHGRIVAGHSLGGAIALRWALRHPEEVRALVLIGAGARLRVRPELLEGIRTGDPRAVERFGALWFGAQADPRLREKSLALLAATPPGALLADLEAADRFDVMEDLGRLDLPAVVLCGAEDRLTPPRFSEALHTRLRGSVLTVVPEAGHMVMLEQPQAVNDAVRAFLARLEEAG